MHAFFSEIADQLGCERDEAERLAVAVIATLEERLSIDDVLELQRERPLDVGAVRVTPFEVVHPSGAPSYALRFELDGKVLSFTGDSEWTESLVPAGRDADLYIMECYQFEGEPRFHMSWKRIASELGRIGAKRVMLTHMAEGMLARRNEVSDPRIIMAEDGLVLDV